MPRAVLFDVDGTLIDSVDLHARAWVDTFKHFGLQAAFTDVRADIGKGGDQLMPGYVPPDMLEERGEEIERHRGELFKRVYLPQVRAFPGVRPLFERIRGEGVRIALASSASGAELESYLEITGVGDLLDASTSGDDAERSKPFPDIFQAALGRLEGVQPGEALVIGDTPYDAEAARAAGMRAVGVLSGGFSAESLRSAGCIAIYDGPEDLLRRYDSSPLASDAAGQTRQA
jgi:HAD superfamily hydrolase (TIGR01509 family)